jgi:nitrate reductase NapAB chaperone NapD
VPLNKREYGRYLTDGILKGDNIMVAGVLIKADPAKTKAAYEQIRSIEGVVNLTAVFGRFDLIAMIRALDLDGASTIVGKIRNVDGIIGTETLIATTP